MLDLSIIIVSWNVREYLLKCIASVKEHIGAISHEIIVVDNNSGDGSADAVEQRYKDIILIRNSENVGFARANNQGYDKSTGEFILLLNPDTVIKPGAIQEVLGFMKRTPGAGVASCRIVSEDGTLQRSTHNFNTILRNLSSAFFIDRLVFICNKKKVYYGDKPAPVDSVGGAFMMVRRAALGNGPILNPDYFMYSEEKDLSLRLSRTGWRTFFVPTGEIIHYGERSTFLMPIKMFLELQRSQAVFFFNFYKAGYALALCVSWEFMLCVQTVSSIGNLFTKEGRSRFVLFLHAALYFPKFALEIGPKKAGRATYSY